MSEEYETEWCDGCRRPYPVVDPEFTERELAETGGYSTCGEPECQEALEQLLESHT